MPNRIKAANANYYRYMVKNVMTDFRFKKKSDSMKKGIKRLAATIIKKGWKAYRGRRG